MTSLQTLIEPLKRELAVPGTFDDVFPDSDDASLAASLADGFAEAQLRGFFPTMTLTQSGDDYVTSADLSLAGTALVVIFTSMRIIRAQIRAMNTMERYKAGPAEFEIQHAASLLKSELDFLQSRLDDLITQATNARIPLAVVIDNYRARVADAFWGAFYSYEFEYNGIPAGLW
ncbi:hypothetical protein GCM10028801_30750 [Nocardioides maradonensis]